jgi:5-formyltetrahydrofolate cyclo-ligase
MQQTRATIRQQIRAERNQLTPLEQQQASLALVEQFAQLSELNHSQHIALYLSVDGELDTRPLIKWLWQQGKKTYLPVIHPFAKGQLLFLDYDATSQMVLNRYQIEEPKLNVTKIKPVTELDLICTPLVSFDSNGHRLGMGGGYYDRTLAAWYTTGIGAIPIGLAHQSQQIDKLPVETWDIPLPKIVTPNKIWQWE